MLARVQPVDIMAKERTDLHEIRCRHIKETGNKISRQGTADWQHIWYKSKDNACWMLISIIEKWTNCEIRKMDYFLTVYRQRFM